MLSIISHASRKVGTAVLVYSDTYTTGKPPGKGYSMSFTAQDFSHLSFNFMNLEMTFRDGYYPTSPQYQDKITKELLDALPISTISYFMRRDRYTHQLVIHDKAAAFLKKWQHGGYPELRPYKTTRSLIAAVIQTAERMTIRPDLDYQGYPRVDDCSPNRCVIYQFHDCHIGKLRLFVKLRVQVYQGTVYIQPDIHEAEH